jgi:hypothetical protein
VPCLPIANGGRLAGVSSADHDFRGAQQGWIAYDVLLPIEPNTSKRLCHKFLQCIGFTGGNNKVVGFFLLKYQPHRLDVFRSLAPVAGDGDVAQMKLFFAASGDSAGGLDDFLCDKALGP